MKTMDYNSLTMARKLSRHRTKQGERMRKLRLDAGISQYELARLVGEPQPNIAYWELSDKPPRSDVLPKLAKALGVQIEYLLNGNTEIEKKNGPTGKVRKVFEDVSKLPRRQQDKVVEFVSAFVKQYAMNA
jgi:transcriptional regulator with XRE-family HTH domain